MDKYLLETLDTREVPLAVRGFLQKALEEFQKSGGYETLALASTARTIASEFRDRGSEALSMVFQGAAWCQLNGFEQAVQSFCSAQAELHRQPSWHQRWNEALALYGLGVAHRRGPGKSIVKAIASFQKALDVLESVRFYYVVEGNGKQVDAIDDLCAELRARISAEFVSPVIDAEEVRSPVTPSSPVLD
jgi:hypothetical protein